jgi:hypothetical protein
MFLDIPVLTYSPPDSVVVDWAERAFPSDELRERLGEVWMDGLQAYREMDSDHQTVIHNERYVAADGVHINQAELGCHRRVTTTFIS